MSLLMSAFNCSHFLCFQNSSPCHYLQTSLIQTGTALFFLLIVIIIPLWHHVAQGTFPFLKCTLGVENDLVTKEKRKKGEAVRG